MLSLLDPEIQADPKLRELGKIAVGQQIMKGFRNVVHPGYYEEGETFRGVVQPTGAARDRRYLKNGRVVDTAYNLSTASPTPLMSDDERKWTEMMLYKRSLGIPEEPGKYEQLSPELRALAGEIYMDAFTGSAQGKALDTAGLSGRIYPKGHPLEGQAVPITLTNAEKKARGQKLFADMAGRVDTATGNPLYGLEIAALHNVALANDDSLAQDIGNIRQGPAGLNSSVGNAEGEDFYNAIRTGYNDKVKAERAMEAEVKLNNDIDGVLNLILNEKSRRRKK